MMCLWAWASNKKKYYFFASLKSMKKGVGSGVRSGSSSLRYGSSDPDPHQNVTDPGHCHTGLAIKNPSEKTHPKKTT